VRWTNVQAIDVKFSQHLTHQKSLKSVKFWQCYSKNKKVDVFWDTVYSYVHIRRSVITQYTCVPHSISSIEHARVRHYNSWKTVLQFNTRKWPAFEVVFEYIKRAFSNWKFQIILFTCVALFYRATLCYRNIRYGCLSVCLRVCLYTVFKKNWNTKLMAITLSNLNRFSKFFHCSTQR